LPRSIPAYFESSYYLGPDEGGEKPHRLLAEALAKTQRAAVAELVSRGKEQIVIIRPYRGALLLQSALRQSLAPPALPLGNRLGHLSKVSYLVLLVYAVTMQTYRAVGHATDSRLSVNKVYRRRHNVKDVEN